MTDFNIDPFAASLNHAFSPQSPAPKGYATGGDVGTLPWKTADDAFGAVLNSGLMPGAPPVPGFMHGAAGAEKAAVPFVSALSSIAGLTSATPWGILGSLALNIGSGIYDKLFGDDQTERIVGNIKPEGYNAAKAWTNQWDKQYGFDPSRDWDLSNQDQNPNKNYLDVITGRKRDGKPTYYIGFDEPTGPYEALKAARRSGNLGGGGDAGVGGPGSDGDAGTGGVGQGPGQGDAGEAGDAGDFAKGGIAGLGYSPSGPPHSGYTTGPGTGTSDSIPAKLSNGEFVFTAKAVKNAGAGNPVAGAQKLYRQMRFLERTARGTP